MKPSWKEWGGWKKKLMQKQRVALNEKMGGNVHWASSHSKLFQNDFFIYDVCWSMNEESALEKLQQLAIKTKIQKIAEWENVKKLEEEH